VLDQAPAVAVPSTHIRYTQLINYVFRSSIDTTYSLITFGSGTLFNHQDPLDDLYHFSSDELLLSDDRMSMADCIREEYSKHPDYIYQTKYPIPAGQEIFLSYGDEKWFTSRNVSINKCEN